MGYTSGCSIIEWRNPLEEPMDRVVLEKMKVEKALTNSGNQEKSIEGIFFVLKCIKKSHPVALGS